MTINAVELAALVTAGVALLTALATALNSRRKAGVDEFTAIVQGNRDLRMDLFTRIAILEERIKENDARILALEEELKQSREENAQLRVEVNQLRHENEELREQIAELEAFRVAATGLDK